MPHTTTKIKPYSYDTYESYHLEGRATINGKTLPVCKIVQENMRQFEPDNDRIADAWDELQQIPELQDAWNALNPQGEQAILYDNHTHWCKHGNSKFDVTMGSYDGAETCELISLYILSHSTTPRHRHRPI